MLLAEEENIREVIMFPMNQRGEDLMMNAPSNVDDKLLKELSIKKNIKKKLGSKKKYSFALSFVRMWATNK